MKEFWTKEVKNIALMVLTGIIIIASIAINVKQCSDNKDLKEINRHNITALKDSIKLYKTKSGDLAAEKLILLGDLKDLELANDSLAQRVKELGVQKPSSVIYVNNDIIHEKHDTTWLYTPGKDFKKSWAFNNKWRDLEGTVSVKDTVAGLTIDKDVVHVDYVIAVEKGKAYVSTQNPYVHFKDIQGIELPKQKQKRWGIGPQVTFGISEDGKMHSSLGVGVTYSLFQF